MRNIERYNIQDYWNNLSPEEAKEARRQVSLKQEKTTQKKRAMRTLARDLLDMDMVEGDEVREALRLRGLDEANMTEAAAILFAQVQKARLGDTEAARFLRDTSGQKPVDNVAIGNMDDKPFASMDLSKLSADQLAELVEEGEDDETRAEEPEEE